MPRLCYIHAIMHNDVYALSYTSARARLFTYISNASKTHAYTIFFEDLWKFISLLQASSVTPYLFFRIYFLSRIESRIIWEINYYDRRAFFELYNDVAYMYGWVKVIARKTSEAKAILLTVYRSKKSIFFCRNVEKERKGAGRKPNTGA